MHAWYLNFVNLQGFADPEKFLTKYDTYLEAFSNNNENEQEDLLRGT